MRRAADRPPEQRGLRRDEVRLLVATPDGLAHGRFGDLPRYLTPGDLLVVNISATLAAAVDGQRAAGQPVTAHFSTPLDDGTWLVELRAADAGGRVRDGEPGETITLPGGASLALLRRYPDPAADRIWTAAVCTGELSTQAYLAQHGRPVRYSYVPQPWPLADYQTVFSREPGSAEMPSAGRPLTAELVTDLVAAGVVIAPVTLHTGVGSLEAGELPLPELFTVPATTAELVNLTLAASRRVIAVGTTVTRALESAASRDGVVKPARGWTDLVLGTSRPATVVTGLVTGWHDPEASHLALLEAVAGQRLISAAYAEADRQGYLGHEFGDSCLLLPPLRGRPVD